MYRAPGHFGLGLSPSSPNPNFNPSVNPAVTYSHHVMDLFFRDPSFLTAFTHMLEAQKRPAAVALQQAQTYGLAPATATTTATYPGPGHGQGYLTSAAAPVVGVAGVPLYTGYGGAQGGAFYAGLGHSHAHGHALQATVQYSQPTYAYTHHHQHAPIFPHPHPHPHTHTYVSPLYTLASADATPRESRRSTFPAAPHSTTDRVAEVRQFGDGSGSGEGSPDGDQSAEEARKNIAGLEIEVGGEGEGKGSSVQGSGRVEQKSTSSRSSGPLVVNGSGSGRRGGRAVVS